MQNAADTSKSTMRRQNFQPASTLNYVIFLSIFEQVSMVMKRRKVDYNANIYGRFRRKANNEATEPDRTFHLVTLALLKSIVSYLNAVYNN